MVVTEVQDLQGAVELEEVAQLGRVLQAVELVVGQVQLPQIHVHLQRRGWGEHGQSAVTGQAPAPGGRPVTARRPRPPSLPSSISGRPDRLAFSRCSTARLLRMRRARATNGAEWSSRGVLRASRYCRQLVWWGRGGAATGRPGPPCPRGRVGTRAP